MTIQSILKMLVNLGALLKGHFVYTSDRHGEDYFNKDGVYVYPKKISQLCYEIAKSVVKKGIHVDVVIGPTIGGVIMSHLVASHLSELTGKEVLSVYAERGEQSIFKAVRETVLNIIDSVFSGTVEIINLNINLFKDESLVVKKKSFVIKRGYEKLIKGKDVLVVEDVITTGGSVKEVIRAVRKNDGNVVCLTALWNRGGVTSEDVGNPPDFFSLIELELDSYSKEECPLCVKNVPINEEVGKGKEFMSRKKAG